MLLTRDGVDILLCVRDPALYRDPTASELLKGLGFEETPDGDAKRLLIRGGGESAEVLTSLPEELSAFADRLDEGGASLRVLVLREGREIDCADFAYLFDETRGELVQTGAAHGE